MVHCNPAPPHPPPGELYAVMCPPIIVGDVLLSWAVSFAFFVVLVLVLGGVFYYLGGTEETVNEHA